MLFPSLLAAAEGPKGGIGRIQIEMGHLTIQTQFASLKVVMAIPVLISTL